MNEVENKVVWITGASSGIGEALAYQFAMHGARLVLSSRRQIELERVKAKCKGAKQVEILLLDVTLIEELPARVNEVLQLMGGVDIMVLNAGISQRSLAIDTRLEVYRKIMEINYFSVVQMTLAVLPYFKQKNAGQVIVISSVAGKAGLPVRTAYCSSKHAVEGFFASLRVELWKTAIKILVVRPGAVKTNIAASALKGDGQTNNQKDETIEKGMPAEKCAAAIVSAAALNKKELMVGSVKEKAFYQLNRFTPNLVFDIIKRILPIDK
jgi:short-subunit dehydrogenase